LHGHLLRHSSTRFPPILIPEQKQPCRCRIPEPAAQGDSGDACQEFRALCRQAEQDEPYKDGHKRQKLTK
jgi:hypothetical protein